MSLGFPAAASPGGAPPSPWLGALLGLALAALHTAVLVGALHAGFVSSRDLSLLVWVVGLSTFGAWCAAWGLKAYLQAKGRADWESRLWKGLRDGVAPEAQRRFGGASGWSVEAYFGQVPGPGAAWADFRQGPADSELAWLVASLPGTHAGVPALVCRAAVSARWQASAQRDLSEAVADAGQVSGAPDAWAAWAARLESTSGALSFAGEGPMLAFTVDRRGRLGFLWGGVPPEGSPTVVEPGPPGQARLAEGSAMLVLDAGLLHAPGPSGEAYGLGRLERLVRERPGCDAHALTDMVVEALQRFHQGAPAPRQGVVAVCRLVACGP